MFWDTDQDIHYIHNTFLVKKKKVSKCTTGRIHTWEALTLLHSNYFNN